MKTLTTEKGTELPLLNLKGKDYLQVAHRLVWFRERHPDWSIETEMKSSSESFALFNATIRNESGRVIATAHKREDQKHFPDFIEKAETGSIGRALALCGFGTQFEPDLDEGMRLADAPASKLDSPRVIPDQPTAEDPQTGFSTDGVYRIPSGTHKGRTLPQVIDIIGQRKLEDTIISFEDRIAKKSPYSGFTMEQMQKFVSEATAFVNSLESENSEFDSFMKHNK